MSASLVGSEMCIRDRHQARAVCLGTPGSRRHRPCPSPCAPTPRTPPGPVSYTHLTLPTICSV
eukprot:13430261-Alexandrium_andersonii.AAC.1